MVVCMHKLKLLEKVRNPAKNGRFGTTLYLLVSFCLRILNGFEILVLNGDDFVITSFLPSQSSFRSSGIISFLSTKCPEKSNRTGLLNDSFSFFHS